VSLWDLHKACIRGRPCSPAWRSRLDGETAVQIANSLQGRSDIDEELCRPGLPRDRSEIYAWRIAAGVAVNVRNLKSPILKSRVSTKELRGTARSSAEAHGIWCMIRVGLTRMILHDRLDHKIGKSYIGKVHKRTEAQRSSTPRAVLFTQEESSWDWSGRTNLFSDRPDTCDAGERERETRKKGIGDRLGKISSVPSSRRRTKSSTSRRSEDRRLW